MSAPGASPSHHQSSETSSRSVSVDPSRRPILVYYHIPSDHDDAHHPNAFPLFRPPSATVSNNSIRLRDIKKSFPLPGRYHFRFKIKVESSFFWIDLSSDDSVVPQYNNKIIAKVLRVDWNASNSESPKPSSPPPDSDSSLNPQIYSRPTSSIPSTKDFPPRSIGSSTIDDMLSLDTPPPVAHSSSHPYMSQSSSPFIRGPQPPLDYSQPPPDQPSTTNWIDDFFG